MPDAQQIDEATEATLRQWLQEHYSLEGTLERLPGESDLNFKLSTAAGEAFVCKFSREPCDRALLAAQNEVMVRLTQRELAAIPRVLISNGGEPLVPFAPASGQTTFAGRVLTYVPGTILAKCAPYSEGLLRDLGSTIGQLDRALVDYDHPALHYTFDWDLAHAMAVVERYGDRIADPQVREGVVRISRDFSDIVVPRLGDLRRSVIHNDANDYNVLAEGDRVTGLIDFGDLVHSCTVCDLAIAMAYASLGADDMLQMIRAVATGYNGAMPLEADELTVLFPMMRMRLAVSACMAAHQVALQPDNLYLTTSQEPIRRTLPRLLALDVSDVAELLRETLA